MQPHLLQFRLLHVAQPRLVHVDSSKTGNPYCYDSDNAVRRDRTFDIIGVATIIAIVFGVIEALGLLLVVSMGFVYPLFGSIVLSMTLVFRKQTVIETHEVRSPKLAWRFVVLLAVVLVLEIGPISCFFSPSIERFYKLPFWLFRKIVW